MKSHINDTYIELPLQAFIKAYPQYAYMIPHSIDVNDTEYIVRMQFQKDGVPLIEIGYAEDEWHIGSSQLKTLPPPIRYTAAPTEEAYHKLSPERKAEFIAAVNKMREQYPDIKTEFDEETGEITVNRPEKE